MPGAPLSHSSTVKMSSFVSSKHEKSVFGCQNTSFLDNWRRVHKRFELGGAGNTSDDAGHVGGLEKGVDDEDAARDSDLVRAVDEEKWRSHHDDSQQYEWRNQNGQEPLKDP